MRARTKININDVRRIVSEEIRTMYEQVDHSAIKDVVTGAQALLSSVDDFKESATPTMLNAVTPQIDELSRVLEDMLSTPTSYVPREKLQPKKVSLRPVKDDDED